MTSHSAAVRSPRLPPKPRRELSAFEFWPDWAMYTPVVLQWIALGLRHLDFSLPSAANPGIATGGLCGESKTEIFDLAEGEARDLIAPYTSFIASGDAAADAAMARRAAEAAGIPFPLVAKPDIGCNGTGVRLVDGPDALQDRLQGYPAGARLVLQELVPWEGEAGIFYSRHPGAERGRISSLTLKIAPSVTGDGRSTLRELILADPRAGRVPQLYLPRLEGKLDRVPQQGEPVRLVFSGNHCKGSVFRDGREDVTPALLEAVERFARGLRGFHFGRIDVRYESLAALRRGSGFRVIEVNGVGSEATHIWDPDTSLREAYAAQFRHYAEAFRIGAAMKRRGTPTCGKWEMLRLWRLQRRLLASYPLND